MALFGALVPGLDRHSSGCLHSSCAHRHPHSRAVRYPDHRAGPAGNNRTGGCSPSYTHPTVPTFPHTGSAGNRNANPRSYAHPGSCSNRGTHTKSYLHPGYGGNAYACSRTNSNAYSRSGANTIPDSSAADSIPDYNALAFPDAGASGHASTNADALALSGPRRLLGNTGYPTLGCRQHH